MNAVNQHADYAWIIDDDLSAQPGERTEIDTFGPLGADSLRVRYLKRGGGTLFRLFDHEWLELYTGRADIGDKLSFADLDLFEFRRAARCIDSALGEGRVAHLKYFDSIKREWIKPAAPEAK